MTDIASDFENISLETVTITRQIDGISNTNDRRGGNCDDVYTCTRRSTYAEGNSWHTGAQGNIILALCIFSLICAPRCWTQVFPNNVTKIPYLWQHNNSMPIRQGEWSDAEFFIADAIGPAIIGLPSCQRPKSQTWGPYTTRGISKLNIRNWQVSWPVTHYDCMWMKWKLSLTEWKRWTS